ncbi:MAG TPA: hypothetical protein VHO94_00365 [Oscillospiraceae bacterium]|nr:hypothetical protein [Oscillospiraceae bacterium]
MDKVKKYVILPVSLLLLELFLQSTRSYMSMCFYVFQDLQFNFGRFMPRILLSFLAVLLFVCGIVVLFLWVFNDTFPKTLLNQSTAKRAILAFAIDYLIILLVEPRLYSLIEPLYKSDITPWLYLIFVSLIMTVRSFFIIYMTVWLILKPVRNKFKFRTKTFLIAALSCLLLNVLFNYVDLQISMAALANFKAHTSGNAMDYLNMFVSSDNYSKFSKTIGLIANTIQDVIILVFINSCIKHKESVEIPNV